MRTTHTSAVLALSSDAYEEIAQRLREAGYDHAVDSEGLIDMHGIAVVRESSALIDSPEWFPGLMVHFLNYASNRMSSAACNDFPEFETLIPDPEARREFVEAYHEWNGSLQEFNPENLDLPDFAVAAFLAECVRKASA